MAHRSRAAAAARRSTCAAASPLCRRASGHPAAMQPPKLLRIPAFVTGVFALFWCFQLACLTGFIKWWRLRGPRNDVHSV